MNHPLLREGISHNPPSHITYLFKYLSLKREIVKNKITSR